MQFQFPHDVLSMTRATVFGEMTRACRDFFIVGALGQIGKYFPFTLG